MPPRPQDAPVTAAYAALAQAGSLTEDPQQRRAAAALDAICNGLARPPALLAQLLRRRQPAVRGAYLVGDVGRGKTLLMDLFFAAAPTSRKRRVHFHEFMGEVHADIAAFRARSKAQGDDADPVAAIVGPLLAETRLLCLDEFHVNDITNAMLLGRLFEKLFDGGLVLVATSNFPPERLYENGLNRALFLPFIALLRQHVRVLALDGPTDYRRLRFADQDVYVFGSGAAATGRLDALWRRLTGGAPEHPDAVASAGRRIVVPRAAMGAARFRFADLCEAPLGAADYLKLAQRYDTIVVDDVPQLDRARSDAARRLILLIDTLYDRGVKFAASFAVPLDELGRDSATGFEFARTLSRLIEMRSRGYLEAPHRAGAGSTDRH